jgi:GalNAc-alpha-(1->4)-GalNAc-alpha-(1->3)-diNAcBac-PP-undecaprenol alpha-1,4-N-acetyl-D-galactosaminyltransferase
MRVTCVISTLWRGGAERALCILADAWAERGHEVSILTFQYDLEGTYSVPSSVTIRSLGLLGKSRHPLPAVWRNVRRIRVLRRAIQASKPDVVVSFMNHTNVLVVCATRGLRIPVIISERTVPLLYSLGPLWSGLRKAIYPLSDVLVCQTKGAVARFQAMTADRGVAIPNPVIVPSEVSRSDSSAAQRKGRILVAMGRLVREKGFDLLLEAFARATAAHPDWSLTIIGKGPLLEELAQQAKALGLSDRVRFAGEQADPFPLLRAADLFAFSSRFEGFGMALAEAMACGLPAISFDCPEGPGDIIRHGVDGILVPREDVAAFAAALDRLMGDSQERARLAARALEVSSRFSLERVMAMWDELFAALGLMPRSSEDRIDRRQEMAK